jgi:methylthioribulose-1-phosphate dehydratase
MPLHRTIVLDRGAGAVLHTHSQAATLLSQQAMGQRSARDQSPAAGLCAATSGAVGETTVGLPQDDGTHVEIAGLEMLKGLAGIQTHESRIQIPVLANDQDLMRLSDAVRPTLRTAPHGVLIAGHGLYAWGANLEEATRHLEILEFLLEQRWRQLLWNACLASHPAGY